jgi:hypothetical protein
LYIPNQTLERDFIVKAFGWGIGWRSSKAASTIILKQ